MFLTVSAILLAFSGGNSRRIPAAGLGTWVAQSSGSRAAMNKKLIIIASAVVVLLGGAGAGVWFFVPGILPEFIRPKDAAHGKETAKREETKKHEPEVGADLEVFVVNLTGSVPGRYLRTSLSVGVKDEHEKEIHHGELIKKLRDVAKEARGVIKDAKTALGMLNKTKKKERRNFKQELKNISSVIKDKKREINKIQKSKQADPTVIAQLKREIILLQQQHKFVDQLNKQVQNTYKAMDGELREMKMLLKAVTKAEKQVGKHEKAAGKREKAVEKRYSALSKHASELERSFENLTNPHNMAIQFSGKLNVFYGNILF